MADIWARGTTVLGVGFPPAATDKISAALKGAGSELVGFSPRLEPILKKPELVTAFSHVIVNLDMYQNVLQAVDDLLAFRKAAPKAAVLCVSKSVGADDFSLERRQICHATLRVPFGLDRLREGFIAATENAASCDLPEGVRWPYRTGTVGPTGNC